MAPRGWNEHFAIRNHPCVFVVTGFVFAWIVRAIHFANFATIGVPARGDVGAFPYAFQWKSVALSPGEVDTFS